MALVNSGCFLEARSEVRVCWFVCACPAMCGCGLWQYGKPVKQDVSCKCVLTCIFHCSCWNKHHWDKLISSQWLRPTSNPMLPAYCITSPNEKALKCKPRPPITDTCTYHVSNMHLRCMYHHPHNLTCLPCMVHASLVSGLAISLGTRL